ncbi:hypothetical protein ACFXAZ_32935 [Streptomyces sp. NPDC059477]|uniref:hypothetical protein n=1 Tax=Streptomyces sp. NPDC059477 TaxID=3346847 RepID=UPI0036B34C13
MSDEYNSDLAYGSPSSDSSDGSYRGQVEGVFFLAAEHTKKMDKIAGFVENVRAQVPEFQAALESAGELIVRFGTHEKGGAAQWNGETRKVTINPDHKDVKGKENESRLVGTAVFELLNAASDFKRQEWEQYALSGQVEEWAAAAGTPAGQYFGYQMEMIEFENVQLHGQIMESLGMQSSRANFLAHLPRDPDAYYAIQCQPSRSGRAPHVHAYEYRYSYIRASAGVQPGGEQRPTAEQAAPATYQSEAGPSGDQNVALAQATQTFSPTRGSGRQRESKQESASRSGGGSSSHKQGRKSRGHGQGR